MYKPNITQKWDIPGDLSLPKPATISIEEKEKKEVERELSYYR